MAYGGSYGNSDLVSIAIDIIAYALVVFPEFGELLTLVLFLIILQAWWNHITKK